MTTETENIQNKASCPIPSVIAHPDESLKHLAAEEESAREKIHGAIEDAAESTKDAASKLANKTAATLNKAAGKIRDWTYNT